MKHEYTDEELALALVKSGYSKELHYKELRHILSTLPDQPDEWERCTFDQVCIGDRIKVVDNHKSGDQTTYEGDVVKVSKTIIKTLDHALHSVYNSKWYRIPAPITRPNPEQHPIILAYEWETDEGLVRNPFNSDLFEWNDHINKYQGKWNALTPEIITDWDPLEIASKEVTTDD